MSMFKELDVVKTVVAIPKAGIAVGALGTIVHVAHKPSLAYLVEFANNKGETLAEEFLTAEEITLDTPA
jgi:phosphohistidine phosphatase SixA